MFQIRTMLLINGFYPLV